MTLKFYWALCAAVMALVVSTVPASAQEKTGTKSGFTLKSGTARIILMRPTVRVGSQSTGGMSEPNADWTAQALQNIVTALRSSQAKLGNEVVAYEEGVSGDGPLTSQYSNLGTSINPLI